jgi:hypothetical protein
MNLSIVWYSVPNNLGNMILIKDASMRFDILALASVAGLALP